MTCMSHLPQSCTHKSENWVKAVFVVVLRGYRQRYTCLMIILVYWIMFRMITSSKVSSMYCKNQWVLLCWRERGEAGCRSADSAPLPTCELRGQPVVLSGSYALGIYVAVSKGFLLYGAMSN